MNYRHAFHAGNFADVVKHVLLTRILAHLRRKESPFRVIDTHAGIGHYDLAADEASRTGEWRGGIGLMTERFEPAVEDLLAPYRAVLAEVSARRGPSVYPGSPAIIREMLRANDRAILIEKHPEDARVLHEHYNRVGTLKVIAADGWTALAGLIPPPERRGLVFIDPPFEEPEELARAPDRIAAALARWPTGILAFWYPLKMGQQAHGLIQSYSRPLLRLELRVDPSRNADRLQGSGMIVINPPWRLAEEARLILRELARRLSRSGDGETLVREITV